MDRDVGEIEKDTPAIAISETEIIFIYRIKTSEILHFPRSAANPYLVGVVFLLVHKGVYTGSTLLRYYNF
ncbi:hypothetical protein SDC9_210250 [bioreactor metagenome]|uniref:Uncharacterized protein n=1 Tax=bioreactor metagenome TaxID=1076179 RepID=A0A645JFW8_9ZZZZ